MLLSVNIWSAGLSLPPLPLAPSFLKFSSKLLLLVRCRRVSLLAIWNARSKRSLQRSVLPRPRADMARELHATIVSLKAFCAAELCRTHEVGVVGFGFVMRSQHSTIIHSSALYDICLPWWQRAKKVKRQGGSIDLCSSRMETATAT